MSAPRSVGFLRPSLHSIGAVATLLLASCQPLPHPFANDVPKPGSPMLTLRDNASVAVAPLKGGPRATAERLAPAIAQALQQREIAASDRAMSIGSYELDGRVQGMPASGKKAAVVVLWNLRDPSGKSLGVRAERVEASADDWRRGSKDAVARLAAVSADQIAAMLQDKLPVKAGRGTQAQASRTEAETGGRTRLRVLGIEGAPGDGAEALASAITTLLKRQDIAVVSDPGAKTDLVLAADVSIATPRVGKQHVKIVWHLRRRDGTEIGTVAQENDVPTGLLDASWGDVAYVVAASAEGGIMELVARSGAPPHGGS